MYLLCRSVYEISGKLVTIHLLVHHTQHWVIWQGLTHPHKRVHHDHASICGICRVLDRSAGIGHFSRVDVYSSLGPCRFSRLDVFNLAPLDTISTMAHTTASRFPFFSFFLFLKRKIFCFYLVLLKILRINLKKRNA